MLDSFEFGHFNTIECLVPGNNNNDPELLMHRERWTPKNATDILTRITIPSILFSTLHDFESLPLFSSTQLNISRKPDNQFYIHHRLRSVKIALFTTHSIPILDKHTQECVSSEFSNAHMNWEFIFRNICINVKPYLKHDLHPSQKHTPMRCSCRFAKDSK